MDQLQQKAGQNKELWNSKKSIAPLDDYFVESIDNMNDYIKKKTQPIITVPEPLNDSEEPVTSNNFLMRHSNLIRSNRNEEDLSAGELLDALEAYHGRYGELSHKLTANIDQLSLLLKQRKQVGENTHDLEHMSRLLVMNKMHLDVLNDQLHQKLSNFVAIRLVNQQINSLNLGSDTEKFFDMLRLIENGILFMEQHANYLESASYLYQYKNSLKAAINNIRNYIFSVLKQAVESISNPATLDIIPETDESCGIDPAIAFFYGKFQALAYKIQPLIREVETRSEINSEYAHLLEEIQQIYTDHRYLLLNTSVANSVKKVTEKNKNDRSMLFRTACSLFLILCQDEHQLYFVFFTKPTDKLRTYLEKICSHLYDALRPFIVQIEHIEILCELCTILKRDMLENVETNQALEPFANVVTELLHDIQERLVFRSHIYFRTSILDYQPSVGDLAYPDKLHMMMNIIAATPKTDLRRTDSSMSNDSMQSAGINSGLNHTDLQGMWYPTVRRTLQCLSQLYRCVDITTFQGLSQEAISCCVQSIDAAANAISLRTTPIDGDLFQIKHLLILREQIASFQVDFTVRETSLDFSKVRSAATQLIQRKNLFAMNSSNAILKFLLDGTPQVKERTLDSKKDADTQLKRTCQHLIAYITEMMTEPLTTFNNNVLAFRAIHNQTSGKQFRAESWAQPELVAKIVTDVKRNIKVKLLEVQEMLSLYIHNRETEAILLRPIKNNIIGAFVQLEQHLSEFLYERDELLMIGCPTADQVSLMLSSVSLLHTSAATPSEKSSEGEKIVEQA